MHLSPLFRNFPLLLYSTIAVLCCVMSANTAFGQKDTSFKEPIRAWRYSPKASSVKPMAVDTIPYRMHQLYPGLNRATFNESLGQAGQPGQQLAIDKRNHGFQMPFIQPYSYYFFTHRDRIGYNTGLPFADITYSVSSKKEQQINFFTTQNVSPYFNFGIRLNFFASEGRFLHSHNAGKMVSAFASYQGSVHRAFISLNFNNFAQEENGGMLHNEYMTDSLSDRFLEMAVNLSQATSISDYHDISVLQEWNLLSGFSALDSLLGDTDRFKLLVGQEFLYSYSARRYRDARPSINSLPYYDTYIDTLSTSDIAVSRILSQEFFGGINHRFSRFVSLGGRGGYGYEFEHSRYNDINFIDPQTDFLSTFFSASFMGKAIGGYSWEATNKQYLTGYRSGDAIINAEAAKTAVLFGDTVLFEAGFSVESVIPQFFYQHYIGNNISWENKFAKRNTQTVSGQISDISNRYSLSIYSALHNGYLYFGQDMLPHQYNSPLSELAVSGSVAYSLGNFHFRHNLTWQTTSASSVLSIPTLVTSNSAYFSRYAFSRLLYLAVGFDLSASSRYYAPRYMPATGVFYLQTDNKTGLYPHTDLFVNCKLKRMRIAAKYSQLGQIVNRVANQKIVGGTPSTVDGYFSGIPHFSVSLAWHFTR